MYLGFRGHGAVLGRLHVPRFQGTRCRVRWTACTQALFVLCFSGFQCLTGTEPSQTRVQFVQWSQKCILCWCRASSSVSHLCRVSFNSLAVCRPVCVSRMHVHACNVCMFGETDTEWQTGLMVCIQFSSCVPLLISGFSHSLFAPVQSRIHQSFSLLLFWGQAWHGSPSLPVSGQGIICDVLIGWSCLVSGSPELSIMCLEVHSCVSWRGEPVHFYVPVICLELPNCVPWRCSSVLYFYVSWITWLCTQKM